MCRPILAPRGLHAARNCHPYRRVDDGFRPAGQSPGCILHETGPKTRPCSSSGALIGGAMISRLTVLTFLLVTSLTYGQFGVATITGRITDPTGAVVAAAVVVV